MKADVFISHHTKSSCEITTKLAEYLERRGIICWYAPRDTVGAYAGSIAAAINACKVFILILNRESSFSEDVLNELNLVTDRIRGGETVLVLPIRISNNPISEDAKYYIGRFHWIDVTQKSIEVYLPEIEQRIRGRYEQNPGKCTTELMRSTEILDNQQFVGRTAELEELQQALWRDRVVFLCGVGGCGKTETARQYAIRYGKQYDVIIFARYESSLQDMIIGDKYFYIPDFIREIKDGRPESDADFCNRKFQRIKELTTRKSLIVIDNFDVFGDDFLEAFLSGSYQVLITTRINFEFLGQRVIHLGAMREDEQTELFDRYYRRMRTDEDQHSIRKICYQLSGHALAIELIAKLMTANRIDPESMLKQLLQQGISPAISGEISHGFDGKNTVYEHISKLFRMEMLSEQQKYILSNLSFMPLDGVRATDFMQWCELTDYGELNWLIEKNWIRHDEMRDQISLHPVIADIVWNQCQVTWEKCQVMMGHLAEKFIESWNMTREERSEYVEIAKLIYYKNKRVTSNQCPFFFCVVYMFKNAGYHDFSERLLNLLKELIGTEPSIALVWLLFHYGDYELNYLNYDLAVSHQKKALNIIHELKMYPYDEAFLQKHLAHLYHAIYRYGNFDTELLVQAEECLNKSRDLFEKVLYDEKEMYGSIFYSCGKNRKMDHQSQSGSRYYAYALNYYLRGNYDLAEQFAQKSYRLYVNIKGESNSDTTAPMWVLALIYSKTGRHQEAIELQKRVIEIRSALWERYQFRFFEQLEILADIYAECGRLSEAVSVLEEMIEGVGDKKDRYKSYFLMIEEKLERIKIIVE